jgi:hypothetical protein
MPYYIHLKSVDIATADLWDLPCFNAATTANSAIADRTTHKVSFRASADESVLWQERETSRFSSGEYVHTPWQADPHVDSQAVADTVNLHYAHLSIKNPGQIAFTKSVEHGVLDRQTSMRPGKYLEEFYKGEFNAEQIADYIARCGASHLELKIATTPDDVATVYMSTSITSCMDGNHFRNAATHPARCYGGSDLGVAYYGPIDDISARSVCWPAKKVYSRLYGNTTVLERLLINAGWHKGYLEGAKIRAIQDRRNSGYRIPYIDYIECAEDTGDGFLVLGEGSINCQSTDGYVEAHENTHSCQNCDREYESDDDCGYCQSCEDDRGCCNTCSNDIWYSNNDSVELQNGVRICERCADRARLECTIEGCDETWIEDEVYTRAERADRTARHVADMCADCAATSIYCAHCDTIQDTGDCLEGRCLDCGHALRCDSTRDLPLSPMDTPDLEGNTIPYGPAEADPIVWDDQGIYRARGLTSPDHLMCCVDECYTRAVFHMQTFNQCCADHYNTHVAVPPIDHPVTLVNYAVEGPAYQSIVDNSSGIWWECTNNVNMSETRWYHDGTRGYYVNTYDPTWQLHDATFGTLDNTTGFTRCDDPRPIIRNMEATSCDLTSPF